MDDLTSRWMPGVVVATFDLGDVVATPGAIEAMEFAGQSPLEFVQRHASQDWGDLCEHDRGVNARAMACGGRLMSVYATTRGDRLYVITEADRSVTTLLLPSEY